MFWLLGVGHPVLPAECAGRTEKLLLLRSVGVYLLLTVGSPGLSRLTVPVPPMDAMQADKLPLTQAMINCSACVNHEPDDVAVAALAALALHASTSAISRVAGGVVCVP